MRYFSDLQNVFLPTPSEFSNDPLYKSLFRKELTTEDILGYTIIVRKDRFVIQSQEHYDENSVIDVGIYYVPKYKKILTADEAYDFMAKHGDENFLLIEDYSTRKANVRALVESEPNNLKISFFSCANDTGHFALLGSLRNKSGTNQWEQPVLGNSPLVASIDLYGSDWAIKIRGEYGSTSNFSLFNVKEKDCFSTRAIMTRWLQIPGCTRLCAKLSYHSICYDIIDSGSIDIRADVVKRYGINPSTENRRYYYGTQYTHPDDVFAGEALSTTTFERVKARIIDYLEKDIGETISIGNYHGSSKMLVKSMLVIGKPLPGHRRPTYHLVKGFKHGGAIDVVEVVCGELLTKDMTPVDCYYLHASTGKFIRVSNQLMSEIRKDIIGRCTVDEISFNEWNDQKAQNPQLLKAISEYQTRQAGEAEGFKIGLEYIRVFNRIKFGALFAEHLIKLGYAKLAVDFAEYVDAYADNMNYRCGSLLDILPGANPDATTLMGALNMNKPCYSLLFNTEHPIERLSELQTRYKVIKAIIPDGVVTTERQKMVNQYLTLEKKRWSSYSCQTGRTVDLIDYPKETKIIHKMIEKIEKAFPGDGDALRHYKEIVYAYFQFKDIGWNPEQAMIFIEFSVNPDTPGETLKMLRDREHAANQALTVYRNKINEEAHKRYEKKYESRKSALKKLESTAELEKKAGPFGGYTVIMPSQIYGETTPRSIEKEGADMNHCVFRSYATEIANGEYTVLYLRSAANPDRALVTIGITRDGRINQTYSKDDNYISEEQAAAIAEWAKSKAGLVSFKSEHRSVNPGGWPYSVKLPELPEVTDKEWLAKLASALE